MFLGYHRKILRVNLTQHKITIEEPDDNFYRKYIGGSATDMYYMLGERRLNMLRAFNAREDLDRSNDTLPKKFFKTLQGDGPSASTALELEKIILAQQWYYCMSGWNVDTGNPTPEALEHLGLEWVDI
tara:strand:- start:204 stop:587 length:384 start_codon:yes stop_codon:yes gene_type:complete